jgi:hypothetical protein
MPENQPRPRQLLDGKQIELLTQHAMVALPGLFLLVQKIVEIFLREKRGPVNALQLRVLLVAQPVGAGNVQQLERFDLPGRRDVRAAAEIQKLAGLVNRNLFLGLGELLDEVALHEVTFALELRQSFVARQKFPRIGKVLLHELLHLLLDLLQVFRCERRGAIEIVEETSVGRRPVA